MSVPVNTNDCLTTAIGLSRTDCNCFGGNIDQYKVSDSSLYLDELEGYNLDVIKSIEDCEAGSLWDIMISAREQAIMYFRSDLMSMSLQSKKQRRQPFFGNIGNGDLRSDGSINAQQSGIRIISNNIIGGVIRINQIGLVMNGVGNFIVKVMNSYSDIPMYEFTLTSVANQIAWKNFTTPLVLKMNHDYGYNPNYYVIYEMISGIQPKKFTASASCSTCSSKNYQYYFNENNPVFRSYEKDRWSEFIMITGIEGGDLEKRSEWAKNSQMNGVMLGVEMTCDSSEIICKNFINYTGNPLSLVMAHAIRYRAGAYAFDQVLASGQINRYTMMDRESIMGKRNSYIKEYNNRIAWLSEQLNYSVNDCLICNDYDDIVKSGILA